jgi:HEAT repeats/Outer membrane lipoprotein
MLRNPGSNKTIASIGRIFLASFVLALISSAGTVFGQQRPSSATVSTRRPSQQTGNDASVVFSSARDLITDGEWAKAQEKFSQYVSSYPNEKNIEAAMYWLAYTQNKLARYDQCRSTIDRLLEKFPNTTWKDDARVLLAQVPGAYAIGYADQVSSLRATPAITAVPAVDGSIIYAPAAPMAQVAVTPAFGQGIGVGGEATIYRLDDLDRPAADDDPCEFKIVVLQALFQTDLQRGIMAATEWLKPGSTQTVRCKSAALTLLGRNGGKSVTPVILGLARNEPDIKLRARAISVLGATNDDTVIDALRDFALNSQENNIVEAAVYALSKHTGDRAITVLSEIAASGKMTAPRKFAISSIATRPGEPAVDALFRIYDADQSVEIRKAVISAFANRKSERAGNRLLEIARGSDNIELRKAAISAISRRGGDKAIEFLLNLYDSEKNEELKDQIINSLGSGSSFYFGPAIASAGVGVGQTTIAPPAGSGFGVNNRMEDQRVIRKLIEIAKSPQAPMERRKRAIGWLSRSKDPEVLKFLEELLKQ